MSRKSTCFQWMKTGEERKWYLFWLSIFVTTNSRQLQKKFQNSAIRQKALILILEWCWKAFDKHLSILKLALTQITCLKVSHTNNKLEPISVVVSYYFIWDVMMKQTTLRLEKMNTNIYKSLVDQASFAMTVDNNCFLRTRTLITLNGP